MQLGLFHGVTHTNGWMNGSTRNGSENHARVQTATPMQATANPRYIKGTFERGGELKSDYPEPTAHHRDHLIVWGKDLRRTIDYVDTRGDLDAHRIAYYGVSWGGALVAILPAIEKRIRANVLYVAGLSFQRALPEADPLNYVTRLTQPTLMLNGELDFFFPAETSQRPKFDLLGTPAEHKKRLTFARAHTAPEPDLIAKSPAWLDRYLGPVEWGVEPGRGRERRRRVRFGRNGSFSSVNVP